MLLSIDRTAAWVLASVVAGWGLLGGAAAPVRAQQDCSTTTPLNGVAFSPGLNGPAVISANYDPDGPGGQTNLLVMAGAFDMAYSLFPLEGLVAWNGSSFERLGSASDPNRPTPVAGSNPPSSSIVAMQALNYQSEGPNGSFLFVAWDFGRKLSYFNGTTWNAVPLRGTIQQMTTWDPDGSGPSPRLLILAGQDLEDPRLTSGFPVVGLVSLAELPDRRYRTLITQAVVTPSSSPGGTVNSLATWDTDGSGPLPESLVFGGLFSRVDFMAGYSNIGMLTPRTPPNPALDPFIYSTMAGGIPANFRLRGATGLVSRLGAGPVFGGRFVVVAGEFDANNSVGDRIRPLLVFDGTQFRIFNEFASFTNVGRITTWDPDGAGTRLGDSVVLNATVETNPPNPTLGDGPFVLSRTDGGFGQVGNLSGLRPGANNSLLGPWDVTGQGLSEQFLMSSSGSGTLASPRRLLQINQTTTWLPVPSTATDGPVNAMTYATLGTGAIPPGQRLYIGGSFTQTADLSNAGNLVSWDGTRFRRMNLGQGVTGVVNALFRTRLAAGLNARDALYVGGSFSVSGSLTLNNVGLISADALGNESVAPLGVGVNGPVRAITRYDVPGGGNSQRLIVFAGEFTQAGGQQASKIATWNPATSTWGTLGSGFNDTVNALAVYDPDGPSGPILPRLYAGGRFNIAGGRSISNLAYWDGTQWQPSDIGQPNGPVNALFPWDRPNLANRFALAVGGSFQQVSGQLSRNMFVWDGQQRTVFPIGPGGGTQGREVTCFALSDQLQASDTFLGERELIVGGGFAGLVDANGGNAGAVFNGLLALDRASGALKQLFGPAVPSRFVDGPVNAIEELSPAGARPTLVVGGAFTEPRGVINNVLLARREFAPYQAAPIAPPAVPPCTGGTLQLAVNALGGGLVYRWQKQSSGGAWLNLNNGPTGTGSSYAGVTTATLTIAGVGAADLGSYRTLLANTCEEVFSFPVTLDSVRACCNADFNGDGFVNPDDLTDFVTCYFSTPPCAGADFNSDAAVNVDDLSDFITAYFVGCP